jgi:hypothetical protein
MIYASARRHCRVQLTMNPMASGGREETLEEDQDEEEFHEEQAEQLEELMEQIKAEDPERFRELEQLEEQFRNSPKGRMLAQQERAREAWDKLGTEEE